MRTEDESDAAGAWHGIVPDVFTSSKKKDKATFYSPSEEWVLLAVSTVKREEREFVVDSGASMHVVSKRDVNSAELETMRISKNPTTVLTRESHGYMSKNWTYS